MPANIKSQLLQLDAFRIFPALNYQGSGHYSFCGFLLTILLYLALGAYFVLSISSMVSTPVLSSTTVYGAKGSNLKLSMKVCPEMRDPSATFDNCMQFKSVDVSSGAYNQEELSGTPYMEHLDGLNTMCVELKDIVLPQNAFVNINFDTTKCYPKLFNLTNTFNYDPEDMGTPLTQKSKQLDIGLMSGAVKYQFMLDKTSYNIDWSHFVSSIEKVEGVSVSSSKYEMLSSGIYTPLSTNILLEFSGKVVTNSRGLTKVPEILAQVGGIMGALALVISVLFGGYFRFKYSENFINGINKKKMETREASLQIADQDHELSSPLDEKKIKLGIAIDPESGALKSSREVMKAPPVLRLSALEYFSCKLQDIRGKKISNGKAESYKAIKEGQVYIDRQLDAVTLLGQLDQMAYRLELESSNTSKQHEKLILLEKRLNELEESSKKSQ